MGRWPPNITNVLFGLSLALLVMGPFLYFSVGWEGEAGRVELHSRGAVGVVFRWGTGEPRWLPRGFFVDVDRATAEGFFADWLADWNPFDFRLSLVVDTGASSPGCAGLLHRGRFRVLVRHWSARGAHRAAPLAAPLETSAPRSPPWTLSEVRLRPARHAAAVSGMRDGSAGRGAWAA